MGDTTRAGLCSVPSLFALETVLCHILPVAFLAFFSLLRTRKMAGSRLAHSEHSLRGLGGVCSTLPWILRNLIRFAACLHVHTAVFLYLLEKPFV